MISSQTTKNVYTGNGAVDTYAYGFKIFSDDDLEVAVRDAAGVRTLLTKTTHYSVTGAGVATGGNVALVNGAFDWIDGDGDLKSGYGIVIRRNRTVVQATDLRNQGAYFPEDIEDQLDKIDMDILTLKELVDRAVKLPEKLTSSDFNPLLPNDILSLAGRVPIYNALGTGWDTGPTVDQISAAQGYATAAGVSASQSAASAAAALASQVAAALSETNAAASAAAAAASAVAAAGANNMSGTRAAPNSITALGGITPPVGQYRNVMFVQGDSAPVDVSANPRIAAGTVIGQELILIGRSDANTVTLQNGQGLSMNGDIVLDEDNVIRFIWDGTNWTEMSRRK